MQEEARLKLSLVEHRQELTLLHCISAVTCVQHTGTGWELHRELLCVHGGQQVLHGDLSLSPVPQSAPGLPSGLLSSSCEARQQCLQSSDLPGQ